MGHQKYETCVKGRNWVQKHRWSSMWLSQGWTENSRDEILPGLFECSCLEAEFRQKISDNAGIGGLVMRERNHYPLVNNLGIQFRVQKNHVLGRFCSRTRPTITVVWICNVPPKLVCWKLGPQCSNVQRWCFWKWLHHEGSNLIRGLILSMG